MPSQSVTVPVFPSSFQNAWQVSRALLYLSAWSGGRQATVWIPQFASLRNHVREIGRSAAGSRVEKLARALSLWPDTAEVSASLPCAGAAGLLAAALAEAPALLELGYPVGEGLDFVTRVPPPAANTRRTPAQIRSAVHHLGGDFGLFRIMMKVPDPHAPCLRAVFSVWPRYSPPGEHQHLGLPFPGQAIPSVLSFRRDLRGYCLLVAYDLAQHLRVAEGIPAAFEGFEAFAAQEGMG